MGLEDLTLTGTLGQIRIKHRKESWVKKRQNPVAKDMNEFGKVGVVISYIQSQMHSDYDSAERIAYSDVEDGEFTKKKKKPLASPLYLQG